MGSGLRRFALACVLVVAATVAVAGGSAANRDGDPHFDAIPGPGRVTYGENIAYRATFENLGGSTFTQVKFRMRVPYAEYGSQPYQVASNPRSTCPTTPVTVTTSSGYDEWICSFPNLPAGSQPLVLTVVWTVPTLAKVDDCDGCLKTNGRWTIKEGINDVADPNDAYPVGGFDLAATLLPAESSTLDSKNAAEAGGYELKQSCTDALGAGSLRTKPTLDLATNPVSTTVCLPDYTIPSSAKNDLGLATTIVEGSGDDGNPDGHPNLGRSDVCIADFGLNCPGGAAHDFGPRRPRSSSGSSTTRSCRRATRSRTSTTTASSSRPATATRDFDHGCVVSITPGKGKIKIWTVVAKAKTNGSWTW